MRLWSAARRDVSSQAVAVGVSAAVLGYSSSVAVLVAGLTAAGATQDQVASGLLVLGLLLAAATIVLSGSTRLPVAVVWSTPGVVLLVNTGTVDGGLPAVLGAFVVAGLLVVLTGLVRPLSRALARLPRALTAAVLAGVLLPFCLVPAQAVADLPVQAGAVVLAWVVAQRWAPRWAAPAALAALVAVLVLGGDAPPRLSLAPQVEWVTPTLTWEALTAVALPLYIVTMAGQNLVGIAVLQAQGYRPPVRRVLVGTGAASVVGAPFAAPTMNLAAITGALTAGPTAHPDPARRWVATSAAGAAYVVLSAVAPLTAAVVTQTDPRLVATAAGVALLGAFAASTADALREEDHRVPAVVTLVVTASGTTALGVGSAAVGLAAGLLLLALERTRRVRG